MKMDQRRFPYNLVHYVLLGMFLGFGLSSILLCVVIAAKEQQLSVTDGLQRLKRDIQIEDDLASSPFEPISGRIEVINKAASQEIFSAESSLYNKDIVDILDVVVLTSTNHDTIRKTWGSDLSHLHFVSPTTDSGVHQPDHLMTGLADACERHHNSDQDVSWLLGVTDHVYVHIPALESLLSSLDGNHPLVIGSTSPSSPSICSVDSISIWSKTSIARICPRIHICRGQGPQCLMEKSGLISIPGDMLVDTFQAATSTEVPTSPMTIFITSQNSHIDMYRTHLTMTELQIQAIQHTLVNFDFDLERGQGHTEVMDTKSLDPDPRSKRESVWNDSDDLIPFKNSFLNESMGPYRQFMDGLEQIYKDACRLHPVGTKTSDMTFEAIEGLALASVPNDIEADAALTFGFKLEKPKVGVEYDFYFVDHKQTVISQVSVQQAYEPVEVRTKDITPFRDLNIITSIQEGSSTAMEYINMVHNNCEEFRTITGKDCYIQLFLSGSSDNLTNITDYEAHQSTININYLKGTDHYNQFYSILKTLKEDLSKDSLLMFLPAESQINTNSLLRCQFNTKLHEEVYFPVVYHSAQSGTVTNDSVKVAKDDNNIIDIGFWANKHFDTFCAHNSDIQDFEARVGDATDLYSLFKWAGFHVHRTLDPDIKLELGHLCESFEASEFELCMDELRFVNI